MFVYASFGCTFGFQIVEALRGELHVTIFCESMCIIQKNITPSRSRNIKFWFVQLHHRNTLLWTGDNNKWLGFMQGKNHNWKHHVLSAYIPVSYFGMTKARKNLGTSCTRGSSFCCRVRPVHACVSCPFTNNIWIPCMQGDDTGSTGNSWVAATWETAVRCAVHRIPHGLEWLLCVLLATWLGATWERAHLRLSMAKLLRFAPLNTYIMQQGTGVEFLGHSSCSRHLNHAHTCSQWERAVQYFLRTDLILLRGPPSLVSKIFWNCCCWNGIVDNNNVLCFNVCR